MMHTLLVFSTGVTFGAILGLFVGARLEYKETSEAVRKLKKTIEDYKKLLGETK